MAGKIRVKQPEPTVFPTGFLDRALLLGKELAACAKWKGEETTGRKGQLMMLRVQMKQAKLFGFGFE